MIKTVNGSGRYMMVNGGMPATTYINTGPGYMNVGEIRYNVSIQRLEVYDGQMWIELNTSHASVGLTPDAEHAIDWARKKMDEERRIDELCEKFPGLKKAKDNYELMLNLVKDESIDKI